MNFNNNRKNKCSKTILHPMELDFFLSFMGKPMLGTKAYEWSAGCAHCL